MGGGLQQGRHVRRPARPGRGVRHGAERVDVRPEDDHLRLPVLRIKHRVRSRQVGEDVGPRQAFPDDLAADRRLGPVPPKVHLAPDPGRRIQPDQVRRDRHMLGPDGHGVRSAEEDDGLGAEPERLLPVARTVILHGDDRPLRPAISVILQPASTHVDERPGEAFLRRHRRDDQVRPGRQQRHRLPSDPQLAALRAGLPDGQVQRIDILNAYLLEASADVLGCLAPLRRARQTVGRPQEHLAIRQEGLGQGVVARRSDERRRRKHKSAGRPSDPQGFQHRAHARPPIRPTRTVTSSRRWMRSMRPSRIHIMRSQTSRRRWS